MSTAVVPPAPPRGRRGWPRWGRWATYAVGTLVLALVACLVTAVRDAWGIPQVYAETSHDLFYAQGYVHAQDRFFEMDVRRHTTAGRGPGRGASHPGLRHQHRRELESSTLGQSVSALVRRLFNRGGYEVGGGGVLVNSTTWDAAADGYDVTAAPSMRMVVSLADLDDSRWVHLTGVSGHAFHPSYVDQTDRWVRGHSLAWPSSREAVAAAPEQTLRLSPAAEQ